MSELRNCIHKRGNCPVLTLYYMYDTCAKCFKGIIIDVYQLPSIFRERITYETIVLFTGRGSAQQHN